MDLGVTNRNGSRFGARALRGVERIGPFHHVLRTVPLTELAVADVADVMFRSRSCLTPRPRTFKPIIAMSRPAV
ncbi:hypothetical protein [Paenirhodobacter sp.]|uniref:hypothetical protein n=1 Tax=Paenirhodobacter sp. TaxID=1965326 RepID=UPI003B50BAFE